jgi:hypothetical protein
MNESIRYHVLKQIQQRKMAEYDRIKAEIEEIRKEAARLDNTAA